jgi:hypothetical protein
MGNLGPDTPCCSPPTLFIQLHVRWRVWSTIAVLVYSKIQQMAKMINVTTCKADQGLDLLFRE